MIFHGIFFSVGGNPVLGSLGTGVDIGEKIITGTGVEEEEVKDEDEEVEEEYEAVEVVGFAEEEDE